MPERGIESFSKKPSSEFVPTPDQSTRLSHDLKTMTSLASLYSSEHYSLGITGGYAVEAHTDGKITRPHGDIDAQIRVLDDFQLDQETQKIKALLEAEHHTKWTLYKAEDKKIEFREEAPDKKFKERRRIELAFFPGKTKWPRQLKTIEFEGNNYEIPVQNISNLAAHKIQILYRHIKEENDTRRTSPTDVRDLQRLISQPHFSYEDCKKELTTYIKFRSQGWMAPGEIEALIEEQMTHALSRVYSESAFSSFFGKIQDFSTKTHEQISQSVEKRHFELQQYLEKQIMVRMIKELQNVVGSNIFGMKVGMALTFTNNKEMSDQQPRPVSKTLTTLLTALSHFPERKVHEQIEWLVKRGFPLGEDQKGKDKWFADNEEKIIKQLSLHGIDVLRWGFVDPYKEQRKIAEREKNEKYYGPFTDIYEAGNKTYIASDPDIQTNFVNDIFKLHEQILEPLKKVGMEVVELKPETIQFTPEQQQDRDNAVHMENEINRLYQQLNPFYEKQKSAGSSEEFDTIQKQMDPIFDEINELYRQSGQLIDGIQRQILISSGYIQEDDNLNRYGIITVRPIQSGAADKPSGVIMGPDGHALYRLNEKLQDENAPNYRVLDGQLVLEENSVRVVPNKPSETIYQPTIYLIAKD